jgi:uncharacterized membrane protein
MEEQQAPVEETELTAEDRMWAALSWLPVSPLWPILAIVALLMESTKDRPFVRYNAVVSIATGVILIPLTIITIGCAGFLYFVFFYWAYQAYQGQQVEVPVVSDWVRNQGWV